MRGERSQIAKLQVGLPSSIAILGVWVAVYTYDVRVDHILRVEADFVESFEELEYGLVVDSWMLRFQQDVCVAVRHGLTVLRNVRIPMGREEAETDFQDVNELDGDSSGVTAVGDDAAIRSDG